MQSRYLGFATLRSHTCRSTLETRENQAKLVTVLLVVSPHWTHLRAFERKTKGKAKEDAGGRGLRQALSSSLAHKPSAWYREHGAPERRTNPELGQAPASDRIRTRAGSHQPSLPTSEATTRQTRVSPLPAISTQGFRLCESPQKTKCNQGFHSRVVKEF